jgi:tetratricopeptide (TPR) repeat protein
MQDQPESSQDSAADPVAMSVAFAAAAFNDRVAVNAEAFLAEQTLLVRLQIEELKREDQIRHWSLRLRHFSDVMKAAFELSAAFIVVVIAVAVGAAMWSAAHDDGLVVEAFSVPPDLAAKGLTGEVVATKLQDRLAALQAQTTSNRAPSSYTNNWGNDIKVEIPDTGVSIGELGRYLRNWLGRETHISGEIYHVGDELAVTARAGSDTSPSFQGPETDLNRLVQQAAEAVYRSTQPYRYAVYLDSHGRDSEARAIYRQLLRNGSTEDRAWANIGLASELSNEGDYTAATATLRRAVAIQPDLALSYENIANNESALSHNEQALQAVKLAIALLRRGRDSGMDSANLPVKRVSEETNLASALGDYRSVLDLDRQIEEMPDRNSWENAMQNDIKACGALHDAGCVAATWQNFPPSTNPLGVVARTATLQLGDILLQHWREAIVLSRSVVPVLEKWARWARYFCGVAKIPFWRSPMPVSEISRPRIV